MVVSNYFVLLSSNIKTKNMKVLTKEEIINETVKFYSADTKRRSVNEEVGNPGCYYVLEDGRNCAVGRCLTTKIKNKLKTSHIHFNNSDFQGLIVGMVKCEWDNTDENLDKLLKPSYRGHNLKFWEALQSLHDVNKNWNETGLTVDGGHELENIKSKYI